MFSVHDAIEESGVAEPVPVVEARILPFFP
jgi:hypothetical protein